MLPITNLSKVSRFIRISLASCSFMALQKSTAEQQRNSKNLKNLFKTRLAGAVGGLAFALKSQDCHSFFLLLAFLLTIFVICGMLLRVFKLQQFDWTTFCSALSFFFLALRTFEARLSQSTSNVVKRQVFCCPKNLFLDIS